VLLVWPLKVTSGIRYVLFFRTEARMRLVVQDKLLC